MARVKAPSRKSVKERDQRTLGKVVSLADGVARSALGAHFRLGIVRGVDAGDAVARARAGGTRVVGLGAEGPPAWTADLKGPMLLHVDGDGNAQGEPVRGLDGDIEPPLTARAASVLSEWVRQRGES